MIKDDLYGNSGFEILFDRGKGGEHLQGGGGAAPYAADVVPAAGAVGGRDGRATVQTRQNSSSITFDAL